MGLPFSTAGGGRDDFDDGAVVDRRRIPLRAAYDFTVESDRDAARLDSSTAPGLRRRSRRGTARRRRSRGSREGLANRARRRPLREPASRRGGSDPTPTPSDPRRPRRTATGHCSRDVDLGGSRGDRRLRARAPRRARRARVAAAHRLRPRDHFARPRRPRARSSRPDDSPRRTIDLARGPAPRLVGAVESAARARSCRVRGGRNGSRSAQHPSGARASPGGQRPTSRLDAALGGRHLDAVVDGGRVRTRSRTCSTPSTSTAVSEQPHRLVGIEPRVAREEDAVGDARGEALEERPDGLARHALVRRRRTRGDVFELFDAGADRSRRSQRAASRSRGHRAARPVTS